MYKLVAIDMDGTLLNPNKEITERTKQALFAAKDLGVRVVLASGRPRPGMQKYLEELQLTSQEDYLIHYNGSIVENVATGEVVHQAILTGKDAKCVAKLAAQLGGYVHAFSLEHGLITPEKNPYTDIEATINQLTITEMDFETLSDDHPIIKTMIVASEDNLKNIITQVPTDFKSTYTVVQSAPFFLEFLNPESNKGVGVAAICQKLGFDASEVICLGDAENDHHMIEYAGLGVAMDNAMPQTKAIADFITDSNENDGVAKVIEQFIINKN
ncbi:MULTISPECIES: Cof-type HAD-IIB family hydrolase [unclassified Vibrio]|uniref:Cof-type HAD-IIB family hydrolase n=1 Tax=Vibrio sp. HB236076 TaxID=3232307 RepID=A0AB39HIP6_9VIBR|nr:Cof-type HAD-IIB family hydrolase [Vibrio sp. HB161653]MDP5254945.1 Cof-type HAD-IIB family hydrolase [Vibrio sp. HB161653]